ncbi:transcription termination/antitermination NusG family protein [[Pseudomonas] boreopolis]|uniref:transcription termination/antitermination NusG family protein n=1 Tax=Xanthomonas boreopolis TaxID=86183 RepID=UPI003DA00256
MRGWHLVLTRPRQERVAMAQLERQGYEVWLPMARDRAGNLDSARVVPLFPRYLFVNVDSETDNTAPIRSTIGCCGLVRFGMTLAMLPAQAAEAIRQRCDDQGCVRTGDDWAPGSRLKVLDGPFAGFEAVFQARSASERVSVLLHWLGVTRPVQMSAGSLKLLAS